MKFFDFLRPKKIYEASDLKIVVDRLFPSIEHVQIPEPNGGTKDIYVDRSLDSNLEACIMAYEDGTAGEQTLTQLKYILKELRKIRIYLDETTFVPNKSYYFVDAPYYDEGFDNIQINKSSEEN